MNATEKRLPAHITEDDIRLISEVIVPGIVAEVRQAVEARAWDEGYEAAARYHEGDGRWVNDVPRRGVRSWVPADPPVNPYR